MRDRKESPPEPSSAEPPSSSGDWSADARVRLAIARRRIERKANGRPATNAKIPSGGGSPLPDAARARMEPHFGDLSGVRIHHGNDSADAAHALGARAFTVDKSIHFGAGELKPGTREGDRLLAHELTHATDGHTDVVERKAVDGEQAAAGDVSKPTDAREQKADQKADQVTNALHDSKDEKPIAPEQFAAMFGFLERWLGKKSQAAEAKPDGQTPNPMTPGPEGATERKADASTADQKPDQATTDPGAFGLNLTVAMSPFAAAAKQVESEWDSLGTEGRLERLTIAANQQLATAQVPECTASTPELGDGELGQFDQLLWDLQVNKKLVDTKSDGAKKLAEIFYHEARHAEQHHKVARLLKGQGKTQAEIVSTTKIRPDVVKQAMSLPPLEGAAQQQLVDGWLKSVHGKGPEAAHRDAVYARLLVTAKELQIKKAEYDAVRKDIDKASEDDLRRTMHAYDAARSAQMKAEFAYKALPEEADAYETSDKLKLLLLES